MSRPSIVTRRAIALSGSLLILFFLIAAAMNVPWAVSRMRSRDASSQVSSITLEGSQLPREWPAITPHNIPWPPPDSWSEGGVFGCRLYDVRAAESQPGRNGFSMVVQHVGWPYPVIEQKQMWWDWDDPRLKGPESDPAPSLLLRGLLLNPLILGGAAWIVLVLPWLAPYIARRWLRHRRGRCMACGYPIGLSPVCTECGRAVSPLNDAPDGAAAAARRFSFLCAIQSLPSLLRAVL